MEVWQKEIPQTTMSKYISGFEALNLIDETSGDWHFLNVWLSAKKVKVQLWGEGQEYDTNAILGNYGVRNKIDAIRHSQLTTNYPEVYAADHKRAILDLLYYSVKNSHINDVYGSTMDFLDTEAQKEEVLLKAKKFIDCKQITKTENDLLKFWIKNESRPSYRGVSYGI